MNNTNRLNQTFYIQGRVYMENLSGNMLIAHGGGPTPVINGSLQGALMEAKKHPEIKKVYAARYGAEGILANDLIDLTDLDDEAIANLSNTPSSTIGSCRRKLKEADYPAVLDCLKKNDIRFFFYNGGNDSMDTCAKISKLAEDSGYPVNVIGIPKTVDNDLIITDHCPGFGSAARYAAVSTLELSFDANTMKDHIEIFEAMGRNAGWITAAASLFQDQMPSELLVYLPEVTFNKEKFIADVKKALAKGRGLVIAVSEGICYENGKCVGDTGAVDGFGHAVLSGVGEELAKILNDEVKVKTRANKPGALGRCSATMQSPVDIEEAIAAGAFAVRSAVEGKTGYMAAIVADRDGDGYKFHMDLAPLSEVANAEKKFPVEWMNEEKNGITEGFKEYCLPLIGGWNKKFSYLREL